MITQILSVFVVPVGYKSFGFKRHRIILYVLNFAFFNIKVSSFLMPSASIGMNSQDERIALLNVFLNSIIS